MAVIYGCRLFITLTGQAIDKFCCRHRDSTIFRSRKNVARVNVVSARGTNISAESLKIADLKFDSLSFQKEKRKRKEIG